MAATNNTTILSPLGTAALAYAARGWHVFPLVPHTKIPMGSAKELLSYAGHTFAHGFKDATTSPDVIRACWLANPSANIGISTGPSGLVVIDVDVKDGKRGAASFRRLEALYGLSEAVQVATPSGGAHYYFSYACADIGSGNGLPDYPGIDIRGFGGFVVAGPSHLKKNAKLKYVEGSYGEPALETPAVPPELAALLVKLAPRDKTRTTALPSESPEASASPDALLAALRVSDTIKDQIRDGLGKNADRSAAVYKLLLMVIGAGHTRAEYLPVFLARGFGISEWPLEKGKADFITHSVEPAEAEVLKRTAGTPAASSGRYAWAKPYVYVLQGNLFMRLETKQLCDDRGFNHKHNRELTNAAEKRLQASRVACDIARIPVVQAVDFAPGEAAIFERDGVTFVNAYRESTLVIPAEYSEAEREAVRLAETHIRNLIPDQHKFDVLMGFLAYCVQHPGRKINFAPVLTGDEGVGKSFIFNMMRKVLGEGNVFQMNGSSLDDKFNSWASGTQLTCVEEVRLQGKDKYAILERLKTHITDDFATVRGMGVANKQVRNYVNFLLGSNYPDALPLKAGDTRYFIISVAAPGTTPGYFDRLHETCNAHPAALRKWLLEYPIAKAFNPRGRAPDGDDKAEMAGLAKSEEQKHAERVIDEIGNGVFGKSELLFSVTWLRRCWNLIEDAPECPGPQTISRHLPEWGFRKVQPLSAGARVANDQVRAGKGLHVLYTKDPKALKEMFPTMERSSIAAALGSVYDDGDLSAKPASAAVDVEHIMYGTSPTSH